MVQIWHDRCIDGSHMNWHVLYTGRTTSCGSFVERPPPVWEVAGSRTGQTKNLKIVLGASSLGAQNYEDITKGLSDLKLMSRVWMIYTWHVKEQNVSIDMRVGYRTVVNCIRLSRPIWLHMCRKGH